MTATCSKPLRPGKDVIERIASEEARRIGVDLGVLLGTGARPANKVMNARRKAMARIVEETGCSATQLGEAWGTDKHAVFRLLDAPRPYNRATMARLSWQYGSVRGRRIAAGKDPKTINDLSAWKRLGAGRNAA
jgi:hypothetical protein